MPRSCNFPNSSFLLLLALSFTTADILTPTKPIRDGETITSPGKIFELGFFSPNNSSNRYVGIWYHNIPVQTVVWVANSESPVTDFSGGFSIRNDGNLVLFAGEENTKWSTNVSIASNATASAALLDNGNLVLRDGTSGPVLWRSFDHPSNTLLPGMKIRLNVKTGERLMLRSWKNNNDPAPGIFSFGINQQDSDQFFIWKRSAPYWRSGYWNARTFNKIPDANNQFLFHIITMRVRDELYFEYSSMYDHTRLVMDTSGELRCQVWNYESKSWGVAWFEPKDRCSLYAACGAFSVCSNHSTPTCECMPGFKPVGSSENSNSVNWSDGCVRKAQLQCGEEDGFVSLGRIKVPDGESMAIAASEEECRAQCVSNCSCSAYAYANMSNGGAPTCLVWYGGLVDVAGSYAVERDEGASDLYIRIAASELSSSKKTSLHVILIVSSVSGVLLIGTIIYHLRMMTKKKGNRKKMTEISIFSSSVANAYYSVDQRNLGEDGMQNQDIPTFSFKSIARATTDFANSNKLGQGGFGTVYKGTLQGGQEIAVKRLAYDSKQGLEEFKNEVILIAKLQHRNLVRLLGYCIEGDEKLLVYEFMPNKSLDFFLFDQNQSKYLDWKKRFNIILGIARGLLYLHQDSRLRVVHRDLKPSNILLDDDMKPKISDFGIARMFGGNQTQANTRRVIGTYGYMSPEYAIRGHFSTESDIFSFGVILLEIISGKKNTRFCEDEDSFGLLKQAWRLWNEEKGMDFIDPSLSESCNALEAMKCIQVGLLCVQEDPNRRPTIASVVTFLCDSATLPTPENPPFCISNSRACHSSNNPKSCSINEVTISLLDGR
eukprot:TRINITY_DN236_c1_g1_i4.p1 TRINITY_DN236_c1_g1~~TRINITY_DN236_c1_g1_i4.p1  ORF type:complete len:830 (+),score=103.11 TRINITY_DN236_c1_g1_i4:54-2543(+)